MSAYKTAIRLVFVTLFVFIYRSAQAAPLLDGTLLTFEPGGNPLGDADCTTGSCFGVEVVSNYWLWVNLEPGNDGGLIIGKSQVSGGQELAPSAANTTPGDMTAAFFYFSHYGTLSSSPDGSSNIFDSNSCHAADCAGLTQINTLYYAWSDNDLFQLGGGTVSNWVVSPDGIGGNNYELDYIVHFPTNMGTIGRTFRLIARGSIIPPDTNNLAPIVNDINIPTDAGAMLDWTPDFIDANSDGHTCEIVDSALFGHATVNTDCTSGTYLPNAGYIVPDSFTYRVTDQGGLFAVATVNVLHVNPFPLGTVLSIEPGNVPFAPDDSPCTIGSCFGIEVGQNTSIWRNFESGTDGGFVLGKNQLSGGQELAPSETNMAPGEMTAAWNLLGSYGTFYADNALNVFSDTSNQRVAINDLSMAWDGRSAQLINGNVNDYRVSFDGDSDGNYSLDYSAEIPSGVFDNVKVKFKLILRGEVILPASDINRPVANDISINSVSDVTTNWFPDFTDEDIGGSHSCAIASNGSNGNATVSSNCSGGTYTSGVGFSGVDTFYYAVTDQTGFSSIGAVTVQVLESQACELPDVCTCEQDFPIAQVTTVGGGQKTIVNASLQTTFTGHIMTETGLTTGGKNLVKICPGTTVKFDTTSSIGTASCIINSAVTASTGQLAAGDKLICTNKPDGNDVDGFAVKNVR